MVKVNTKADPRVVQGDVYREVEYLQGVREVQGIIEVESFVFPLVVVLTQDCDLEQDFNSRQVAGGCGNDKTLISVLVAPMYNAAHFQQGEHLSELGLQREKISWNRSEGRLLRNNERARFHYLAFPDNVAIVPSVIDFKHYFSVSVDYLAQAGMDKFVCRLDPLHREAVCQRFASFLSRIAIPGEDGDSEQVPGEELTGGF